MSRISHSPVFTERLLARLAERPATPLRPGDFVCLCTDKPRDGWELFPVRGVDAAGQAVAVEGEMGATLSVVSINERPGTAVGEPAAAFLDPEATRALCWVPLTGLAPLRIRLSRLKAPS